MLTLLLLVLAATQGADLEALKTRFGAEKDKPAAQRLDTLAALGALKTDDAGAFLLEIVDQDKDAAVRAAALKGLGEWGAPPALQKLVAVAGNSKEQFSLRATALEALTDPPSKEGFPIVRAVTRESGEIRIFAWSGLRRYPLKETEALWREALNDHDALIRSMAMMALSPLKEVRLQDVARAALVSADGEPLIKYASVTVLQVAGGVASTRVFITAANTSDPTLRRLLAEALGSMNDDKSAAEIYAALRSPDPAVRAVMARALGRLKHAQAADRLSEPLKDKVLEVRAAALESVAERKDKSAEALLHREAQSSNEESAAVAIGLLPGFPSEATLQLLLKLAGQYKPGLAIPALEALGELKATEALPVLEKALKAKDWPVRVAAIRAAARLHRKESVDLLVERADKEEGRMLAEIVDALRGLTGKPFGYAPGQWKEWWAGARESFEPPDKAAALLSSQAGMTTYHGVPVLSNRIVFLLDISGSMSETSGSETRIDQAKKELQRVLSQLGSGAQVNLVFFDERLEPWKKGLVPIKANLKEAQAVVQKLAPRGQTNIFDPLEFAFAHKEADTIYLLSDGDPTNGRVIDPDDILREVRKMNRLRQIVIHTISFGPSRFMRELAAENGGHYVEIR
ncbi:MAG TPA: HEAT repeat domain-containing protein [Planctomycetota bacterium]|nr:HEAT repeat domain-containing protein [Planctomycetota bacterium]